jgi:hypothetical protein
MSDSENSRSSRYVIAVDITFHSEDVDILFRGRDRGKKSAYIPRYPVVARALKDIYAQMHADNPFAETMLIDFEGRLDEVFALADTRIARCQELAAHAQQQNGVTVRPFTRDHPFVHTSVVTLSEYGRYLLRCYGRLDRAICWIRAVNSVGLMDSKPAQQVIRELLRRLRSVNDLMIGYAKRLQPVTRQEVRDRSPRAMAAVKVLQKCVTVEVLNKQTRCRLYRIPLMGQPRDTPGADPEEAGFYEYDPEETPPGIDPATQTGRPRTDAPPVSRKR